MGLSALERPPGAPTEVTTRDRVIIGGRRLEDLFADVMTGRLTYESNLLRILCRRTLDADLADLAAPMLIGLATGQADGRDLACVRLSASTHAPFEQAILPFLHFGERFAQTMKWLRFGHCRAVPTVPAGAELARRLRAMLKEARPSSPYLSTLDACTSLTAEHVAAAYLLECGLRPDDAPFVKIAARLPVAGAVFLDELGQRPNRFNGIDKNGENRSANALAAVGLELLEARSNFAAAMIRLALGRSVDNLEAVPINAALVAGAEYGGSSASSLMMRMICDDGVSAADAMQAMIATFGCYHLGALKGSAAIIASVAGGTCIDEAIVRHGIVDPSGRIRVIGFGHRFQRRDPRAVLLLDLCRKCYPGRFFDAAAQLDEELGARRIGYINMDGIGAAMGLQGGMASDIAPLVTLVARTPGICNALRQATPLPGDCNLRTRIGLV